MHMCGGPVALWAQAPSSAPLPFEVGGARAPGGAMALLDINVYYLEGPRAAWQSGAAQ